MQYDAETTLEGTVVRLAPLRIEHVDALCEVGLDDDIWRWMPVHVRDRSGMRRFVEEALEARLAGTAIPFVTTLRQSGRVIGTTRFMNLAPLHRRTEIGATWIGASWQRTSVNTEAKYLMLQHAFEQWRLMRVEFKTDARNARSRAALLRVGAVEEGTFRKHMLVDDGSIRDSVYFSVVDDEWPAVKTALERRLSQG